jgi:NitT/TauT family transport system substrate-binding protein
MKERERLGLLADLPPEQGEEILPYYKQAAEEGLFTQDCGGREAAREDLAFYHTAGQIKDDPATLAVEDFWYLEPLQKAVRNVEESGS